MNGSRIRPLPPESETVEWKQSFGEWREIVETCAAFASSQGGTVYIGVSPKGEQVGIQIGQGSLEDLANKIKINIDPPQFPSMDIKSIENSPVIVIRVEPNPVKPTWAFGRPLKRVGRTNQFLRRDEAHRLLEMSTGRSWDALTCPRFAGKDVDKKAVRAYLERAGMSLATPFEDVLRNIKLPFNSHAHCNATVLLFGKSPQSFFVESQLKCARFKGIDSVDFQDEQTYEGPILRQFEDAMGFVGRHTRRAYLITGKPEREVVPEYPEDAVREAVINALCHRNYATVGTIQVRIYDNRVEVWNPGHLPDGLTLRELYHRHASRPGNPLIAQALYRARLIEHWGTGTLRIVRACKNAGIHTQFASEGGFFIVTLRKQDEQVGSKVESRVGSKVESLSQRMLDILARAPLSKLDLAKSIGREKVDGQVHVIVNDLLSSELIERTIPDKPNSRLQKYSLTTKGRSLLKRGKR